jgi:hypothetical protein
MVSHAAGWCVHLMPLADMIGWFPLPFSIGTPHLLLLRSGVGFSFASEAIRFFCHVAGAPTTKKDWFGVWGSHLL